MESDLLKDYEKFVDEVTSYASKHPKNFIDEVERNSENGVNVIFDIDVIGGINIKELFPERTLAIFVQPPSIEALEERLKKRGDNSPEEIDKRVEKAIKEIEYSSAFDEIILNANLEESKKIASKYVDKFLNQ